MIAGGTNSAPSPASPFEEQERQMESRLLTIAPPLMIAFAFILIQLDTWRMLARTFLSMWIHELGHAVAAWFSGRMAVPGPWVTRLGDGQSFVVIILVAAVIGFIGYAGWRQQKRWMVAVAALLGCIQIYCTFLLDRIAGDALITFFGDGGGMVLGAMLMATFWSPVGSYLHKQWLRWGFLFIGAFAYVDALKTWWDAKRDPSTIPYGEIEGVGHSDPTKLVFEHQWPQDVLISRYLSLAVACLIALVALYGWSVYRRRSSDAISG